MSFDSVATLEIPQGATELTTSDLKQISGGYGYEGCYGYKSECGYKHKYGDYKHEYGYKRRYYSKHYGHKYGWGGKCDN